MEPTETSREKKASLSKIPLGFFNIFISVWQQSTESSCKFVLVALFAY